MQQRIINNHYTDEELENLRSISFETTVIFIIANYQYITTNLAYSMGHPFKQSFL